MVMFVLYEMQGDDDVTPTLITSSRTKLFRRVNALFTDEATFSAVRVERNRPDITLAQGYTSTRGYQRRLREGV